LFACCTATQRSPEGISVNDGGRLASEVAVPTLEMEKQKNNQLFFGEKVVSRPFPFFLCFFGGETPI